MTRIALAALLALALTGHAAAQDKTETWNGDGSPTSIPVPKRAALLTEQEIAVAKQLLMRGAGTDEQAFRAVVHLMNKLDAAEPVEKPEQKETDE